MFIKSAGTILAILVGCQAVKLPSYFKPCKKDNTLNECIVEVANAGMQSLIKGDPSVHVVNLNPLHVNEMFVDVNGNLKMNFTNFDLFGLENLKVEKADWDFDSNKIALDFRIPVAGIIGTYDTSGRILILPINGVGPCNITYVNGLYKLRMDYKMRVKNGKEYYDVQKATMRYDLDRAYFKLDNLFGGNPRLGEEMSKFLDENWKEVNQEVGSKVGDALAQIFMQIIKSFLNRIPVSDLWS